jgi:glucose-1-phosphate thymidylyltransferase
MVKDAIILAGGTGTRLFPLTNVINKHLLSVNGKFIIDYPLKTLKDIGIENCTVVLGGSHFSQVVDHLKDGKNHGMNFNYVYQENPKGIAQAISLCQKFVKDKFITILGDNLFQSPIKFNNLDGAQIALTTHADAHRFGVAICRTWAQTIDNKVRIERLEEKPKKIDRRYRYYVITGCYQFDQQYFEYYKNIKPSARNEFEIIDIIQQYHNDNKLNSVLIENLWTDAGTHESIAYANQHFKL